MRSNSPSVSRPGTPFPPFRSSIPDGERFSQRHVYECLCFLLSAHAWPENLLTLRAYYQLENILKEVRKRPS